MIQVNYYKKVCHLTDNEKNKINEFFKTMFNLKDISEIKLYLDKKGGLIAEIEGLEEPISTVIEEA